MLWAVRRIEQVVGVLQAKDTVTTGRWGDE